MISQFCLSESKNECFGDLFERIIVFSHLINSGPVGNDWAWYSTFYEKKSFIIDIENKANLLKSYKFTQKYMNSSQISFILLKTFPVILERVEVHSRTLNPTSTNPIWFPSQIQNPAEQVVTGRCPKRPRKRKQRRNPRSSLFKQLQLRKNELNWSFSRSRMEHLEKVTATDSNETEHL